MEMMNKAARFHKIYNRNLEKQYRGKKSSMKKVIVGIFLVVVIAAAAGLLVFTPQRMIIGTWEYDFDKSFMFYYGDQLKMDTPLYYTLSFADKTRMSTGQTYYVSNGELGIKQPWEGSYTKFKVSYLHPNELALWSGEMGKDMICTYNVYRKK